MPENSIPKEAAYQIINDELMLDGNPRLNLASFVTTWMEPECDKLIMASVNKNYVDMDEYPVTTELQVRSHPTCHRHPRHLSFRQAEPACDFASVCLAFLGRRAPCFWSVRCDRIRGLSLATFFPNTGDPVSVIK